MKVISKSDFEKRKANLGLIIWLYAESKKGKTTSVFQSAPDPIFGLGCDRDFTSALEAANRPDLQYDIAYYEDFMDCMEFLNDHSNFKKHKTILIDGVSEMMNVSLMSEIEDEGMDEKERKDGVPRTLINRITAVGSWDKYNFIAAYMFRFLNIVIQLQREGKTIIFTSLLASSPKYNKDLEAGPALAGKQFSLNMPARIDLIGKVESRYDDDGNIIYPPGVRFECKDGSFLAGWSGNPDAVKVRKLDIQSIISATKMKEGKK